MSYKQQIINNIIGMSGAHSCYELFRDFVEMAALSIQNSCSLHDSFYQAREKQYLELAKKYNKKELDKMIENFGLLQLALEENMEDVLGQVYMGSGCGSKYTGQFFTPFHLAELTAKIVATGDDEKIKLIEPSSGGGAMIIGAAKALKDKDINYQSKLEVVAQDLDWIGVYMTYVQISLLGISGVVVQGDSLKETYHEGYDRHKVLITPRKAGAIL